MKPKDVRLGHVYFEFRKVRSYIRVSAIDPITNTEIQMVGDPSVGEEELKRIAVRKLRYVIAKNMPDEPEDGSVIA